MSPSHEERRPLADNQGSGGAHDQPGGGDRHQRNPPAAARPTPGDAARARLRGRLRRLAATAGRPLRSRLDEAEHLAARRVGELARMRSVGE